MKRRESRIIEITKKKGDKYVIQCIDNSKIKKNKAGLQKWIIIQDQHRVLNTVKKNSKTITEM